MKVKCSVSHKRVWRKEGRKNKSMVSARGEEERGKQNGWRIFYLFYRKTDHRRSGSSHNGGAQLAGGGCSCSNRDCMPVMACNVGTHRAVIFVTRRCTSE
jgi:hypothetical protein